jgi:hypothetical protein
MMSGWQLPAPQSASFVHNVAGLFEHVRQLLFAFTPPLQDAQRELSPL